MLYEAACMHEVCMRYACSPEGGVLQREGVLLPWTLVGALGLLQLGTMGLAAWLALRSRRCPTRRCPTSDSLSTRQSRANKGGGHKGSRRTAPSSSPAPPSSSDLNRWVELDSELDSHGEPAHVRHDS